MNIEKDEISILKNLLNSILALGVFIPQIRVISAVLILFKQINPVLAQLVSAVVNKGNVEFVVFSPSKLQVASFFDRFGILADRLVYINNSEMRLIYKDFLFGIPSKEIMLKYEISKKEVDKVKKWKDQMISEFIAKMHKEINDSHDNILVGEIIEDGLANAQDAISEAVQLNYKNLVGKNSRNVIQELLNTVKIMGE